MNKEDLSDLEKLLKLQIHLHGNTSIEVADVLYQMALVHLRNRDYHDADLMFKRSLEIHESSYHVDQQRLKEIRRRLIEIFEARQREAEEGPERLRISSDRVPIFVVKKESLMPKDISEKDTELFQANQHVKELRLAPGPATVALADALTKLADVYCRRQQLDEMEPLLLEALEIRETTCGVNHLSVATESKNLARLYIATEQFAKAERLLKRGISIREGALGKYHPHVADLAELYIIVLKRSRREAEAAAMEQVITTSRAQYGSDWEKFKEAGEKALATRDYVEAQAMWLAAFEEAKEFKVGDPRLSTTLENLAQVYWKRGKFDKAAPICKQILQISETLLGKDHSDVAVAANNLALVFDRQGRYTEAVILYQQALDIKEKHLGPSHPDVLAIRDAHSVARQMSQKQVAQKVERATAAPWTNN